MPSVSQRISIATALALAGVATLVLALSFGGAVASSSGGADAGLAKIAGEHVGYVSATPAEKDNTTSTTGDHEGVVAFGQGTVTSVSSLSGGRLVSRATVEIPDVDLFDGRITADAVHVVAVAFADADLAAAEIDDSAVSGLRVDGVSVDGGIVVVPDLGTLTVRATDVTPPGEWASAEVAGLYLELSTEAGGLPAGSVIMVGHATARADTATYVTLAGVTTPTPTPTTTTTKPTPTATATRTPTPTPTRTGGVVLPAGGGYTGSSDTTYSMPPAGPADAGLLARFPGAVFPVVGSYNYVDTWHAPRAGGRLHEGTDVFAAYGTPIVAVQDGVISNVSTYGIGGNNLRLSNDQGDYFYYAHLSSFAAGLSQGQRVKAGQTVGYVGTTGDAQGTSPHLHFEIHPLGGAAVNPYPYLNAWRGAGSSIGVAGVGDTGGTSSDPAAAAFPKKQAGNAGGEADLAAAVDRAATGLAALDATLAGGRESEPDEPSTGATVLALLSTAGVLAVKKLKLAILLS